ncbi:MAG: NAD(P)/FAD-dependent oxidoreductase, partial [Chloroflexi bacterium]|nr:NAD(P)/FAD-dependent oxidoreductase [Chloroflexota bacterium]
MAQNTKVVIVGAGHNGLVAAGYLARAGLDVQVLERRDVVGGAVVTEEWFPGYHISTCSYVCHILQKKVIDDLEMRKHGFHVYPIDPGRVHPYPNGKALTFWHDDARTVEDLAGQSPEDAVAWFEWANFWHRAVRILSDYYLGPPPSLAELAARFRQEGEEELLETLLTVPLRELVERYFVSDEVKAAVAIGAFDMGDISAPGSAYITALYRFSAFREDTENYGIVRGGMGGITQSLARSAEESGVTIKTGAEVRRILANNGKATGVELENGEVIEADVVLSNADPKRTYLKLIDESDLDDEFVDEVKALKTQAASAKFLCAMKELPDFSRHLGSDFNPEHLAMMTLSPSIDQCQNAWNDAQNGRITDTPIMQLQIPSVYDKTVAPDGHHVLSLWVYYLPPHLP